jgi:hypothetical protein
VSDRFIERRGLRTPNWQPACLKGPFFCGAVALILLHSAMCAAVIVLNYTENKVFTFAASNTGAFLLWHFIPMIVAVIPGLIWEGIYNEVCRLQPYRDLASSRGSTLKDSLSQTYLTSFSWFVPYHALRHPNDHRALAMICITYLLSYGMVPAVTAAMIEVRWNSDYTESTVRPIVWLISLGLLASVLAVASAIAAFVMLHRQKSGLYSSSASLADLESLIAQSHILQKFQAIPSFETQEGLDKALGALQLGLLHTGTSQRITLLDPDQAVQESTKSVWQRDFKEAHPWWLRGRTYVGLNIILLVPVAVVTVVLYQQAYTSITEQDITHVNGNTPAIKVCSAILALANAAVYSNWHLNVALLQPYHLLAGYWPGASPPAQGTQHSKLQGSSSALRMDFAGSALFNLTRPGPLTFDVWLMAVCALLTQLGVVIRPATFQNLALIVAYGLQNSSAGYSSYDAYDLNIPAGVPPLRIILYVYEGIYGFTAFIALLVVMIKKRKPFLPRKPYTLSSHILYLCHSTELLEDLDGMSMLSKKARDARLKRNGRKYALGWVENEAKTGSYIGINRLERIGRRFQYPKADDRDIQQSRLEVSRDEYERRYPGNDYGGKVRRDAE